VRSPNGNSPLRHVVHDIVYRLGREAVDDARSLAIVRSRSRFLVCCAVASAARSRSAYSCSRSRRRSSSD
jgi:hypothetical protein